MRLLTELQRRRRDNRLILGLVLAVLVVWSVVSVLEDRASEMDPVTITRGLLLFVLSYINITLIAAVLFVLCRVLVKTWLERRRAGPRLALPDQAARHLHRVDRDPDRAPLLHGDGAPPALDRPVVLDPRAGSRGPGAGGPGHGGEAGRGRDAREGEDARRDSAPTPARPNAWTSCAGRRRLDSVEAYRGGQRLALAAENPASVPPLPSESLRKAAARRPGGQDRGPSRRVASLPGSRAGKEISCGRRGPAWARSSRARSTPSRPPGASTGSWRRRNRPSRPPTSRRFSSSRSRSSSRPSGRARRSPAGSPDRSPRSPNPRAGSTPGTSPRAWTCRRPTSSASSSTPSTAWPRACRRPATRSCAPTRSCRLPTAGWTWSAGSSRRCSSP